MPKRSDIRIRDPFVLAEREEGFYYLYGTTDVTAWKGPGIGFDAYRSRDLEHWEGPYPAFRPTGQFWGTENFWAPEVHRLGGRYYMFASFKAPGKCRGTHVLGADDPLGPFAPLSDVPATPLHWECLDGTLHVDPEGRPWLVYCREWLQTTDGEMYAQPLNAELSATAGEPLRLFTATEAPWVRAVEYDAEEGMKRGYVTDGPFLFRPEDGQLWMIWSSHGEEGYAIGLAISESGQIRGPWKQAEEPFFSRDGGHGMLFSTFDGQLTLALHRPNSTPDERPLFLRTRIVGGKIHLEEP